MVRDTVEPTFKDTLPGPLSTLHFTKLELGAVPLVLDNILVRELQSLQEYGGGTQQSDYLQFEWDVCWNSTCNIQLETDIIGIGGFGAPISFGVKGITLNGRLQIIAYVYCILCLVLEYCISNLRCIHSDSIVIFSSPLPPRKNIRYTHSLLLHIFVFPLFFFSYSKCDPYTVGNPYRRPCRVSMQSNLRL